mmetsp:Transcript_9735/g.19027  ORF Transcript_9735/g.19027 Transcript_9735/m.19027 type:complete len:111 (+) Transcript_9735:2342-2674(+)
MVHFLVSPAQSLKTRFAKLHIKMVPARSHEASHPDKFRQLLKENTELMLKVTELEIQLELATRKRKAENHSPQQDYRRRVNELRAPSVRKTPSLKMLAAARNPPVLFTLK